MITVKCSSLQILEGLWKVYKSGYLNQVVQETLMTHEVLDILGIDEVKLIVSISEQEYERGKQIFADNSGERAALLFFSAHRASVWSKNKGRGGGGGEEGRSLAPPLDPPLGFSFKIDFYFFWSRSGQFRSVSEILFFVFTVY